MNLESAGFRLGEWIVDPMSGAFQKGDHTVHVEPKVMDVLLCLAKQPGQVISRDDLFMQVWGDVVVSEEVLTRCISELRTLLGDTSRERRFIKTIPKRGYALIMVVTPLSTPDEEPLEGARETASVKSASTPLSRPVRSHQQMPMTAFLIMLSITLGWFLYQHLYSSTPPLAQEQNEPIPLFKDKNANSEALPPDTVIKQKKIQSVAVLPFLHMHGDPKYAFFSEGLAEDIRNALMTHYNLRVAARTSSEAFLAKNMDVRKIGDQLRVDAIVEGSVRMSGEQVRITVRLTITEDGYLVWANTFDRTLDNMFIVQSEISEEIAKQLLPTFHDVVRDKDKENEVFIQVKSRPTPSCSDDCHTPVAGNKQFALNTPQNAEAYEAYTLGRHHWHKREKESFTKAIEYFEKALKYDDHFALAYSGLADAYVLGAVYNSDINTDDVLPKAIEYADRALKLAPSLAEAYASRGIIHEVKGESEKARQFYEHAVNLKPHYSMARMWLGNAWLDLGHVSKAYEQYKVALDVDPLHPVVQQNYLNVLINMGQYSRALELAQNYHQVSESERFVKVQVGVLFSSGQYDKVLSLIEEHGKQDADSHFAMYLMEVLWFMGRFEEGDALLEARKDKMKKIEYLFQQVNRNIIQRDAEALLTLAMTLESLAKTDLINSDEKQMLKPECLATSANYIKGIAAYIQEDYPQAVEYFSKIKSVDKLIQEQHNSQILHCFSEPSKKGEFFAYYADAMMQSGMKSDAMEVQTQGLAVISEARQQGWNTADLWMAEAGLRMVTGDYQAAKFMFSGTDCAAYGA
ncbi:MAG: winged helix-turn-helix domain-containing protein, partial [Pseudomonadota bacterium]